MIGRHVDEHGTTLVEVLAAVALISIAFLVILGGMMTSAVGSDVHRKVTVADLELRTYAEAVQAAPYTDCAAVSDYAPAAVGYGAPAGFQASATAVAYWQPDADPATGTFAGTCSTDEGLQQVSLRVVAIDGRATAARDVLVRRP